MIGFLVSRWFVCCLTCFVAVSCLSLRLCGFFWCCMFVGCVAVLGVDRFMGA